MGQYAKAIYATVVAFVGALGTALVSDQSLADLDAKTWLVVIATTLAAGGGVFQITNSPPSNP